MSESYNLIQSKLSTVYSEVCYKYAVALCSGSRPTNSNKSLIKYTVRSSLFFKEIPLRWTTPLFKQMILNETGTYLFESIFIFYIWALVHPLKSLIFSPQAFLSRQWPVWGSLGWNWDCIFWRRPPSPPRYLSWGHAGLGLSP